MPNLLLGNPLQSLNEGMQTGRANRFNALAGQAVAAAPDQRGDLIAQAAQADPLKAVALNGALTQQDGSDEDRRNKTLVNMSRTLLTAPEQYRDQIYQQMKPSLVKVGLSQVPDVYTPEVGQVAKSIVDAWTPVTATPSGFREFQMQAKAAGLKEGTPEYEQAARVALGTEGRASNAGFGFETAEGADGRKYLQRRNPRTGAVEVYDPRTGDFAPVGGSPPVTGASAGQSQAPQLVGPVQYQPTGAAAPSSTPADEANALLAQGVPADQAAMRVAAKRQQQLGGAYPTLVFKDGKFSDGGSGGTPERPPADPSLLVSRAPEATAAATEDAKQGVQLAYLPKTEAVKAQADIERAGGTARAKGMAERELDQPQAQASVNDASTNLDRMAQAANDLIHHPGLKGITSWNARIPDAPGSQAANARALLTSLKSQIGFSVLQAMRNASKTGGALGAVSDSEGVRLENNLAALEQSQSPEAFQSNLQKIIEYANSTKGRLNHAFEQTYNGARQGSPSAPTQSQHPVPQTQADFDALPAGSLYVDPDDGQTYRKP